MKVDQEKFNSYNIVTHITELICQTQVTQYFKNTHSSPIELEIMLPTLSNCNITKFEMIKNNKKGVSILLDKGMAQEKYIDIIKTEYYGLISYNEGIENRVCLGNISSGEEIELRTFFFGHIKKDDFSYQASFPVKFPNFIIRYPNPEEIPEKCSYKDIIVNLTIYINTLSKITRLVIHGSKNFSKVKKFSEDKTSAKIYIVKYDLSEKDTPGFITFRTEKINDEMLYFQCDPRRNKSYYIFQKTLNKPEFNKELNDDIIDEDENRKYASSLKTFDNEEKSKVCYIFLIDNYLIDDKTLNLVRKSLLLFLQSLHENCYFQLVSSGSDSTSFSNRPLEYNKKNVKQLIDAIKNLKAYNRDSELFQLLNQIYKNNIYDEYKMEKHIILLTSRIYESNEEEVFNLIDANSKRFILHSIGIDNCNKKLIEKSALIGNGYAYYVSKIKQLNSVVISLLDKSQKLISLNISTIQKCFIEDDNLKVINKNDYFTHGFILNDINSRDIVLKIRYFEKVTKLSFDKNKIIKLPDGDNLGKLIVDNYIKSRKCKDKNTRVSLSKEYNILIGETAFYAIPVKDKTAKIPHEDKKALNCNDEIFGYDREEDNNEEKQGMFNGFVSKIFNSDNIIKKKKYKYKPFVPKLSNKKEDIQIRAIEDYKICTEPDGYCCCCNGPDFPFDNDEYYIDRFGFKTNINVILDNFDREEKKNIIKKPVFNFDDFIISQDIIEGNWTKETQSEMLIEQEKEMFEKIKTFCENKGIKDESGIITLFALFYIYTKENDKLDELKFIINKGKKYVKKIFNSDYDDIIKEIEPK